MKFNFEIKNFGKIEKANLDIKPLTIIAGRNDSGKSFATKSLYSFLSVLNIDYLSLEINNELTKLQENLDSFQNNFASIRQSKEDKNFINEFIHHLEQFNKLLETSKKRSLIEQFQWNDNEKGIILKVEKILNIYIKNQKTKTVKYKKLKYYLDNIKQSLSTLKNNFESPRDTISFEIGKNLKDKLLKNFQITKLKDLHNFNSKKSESSFKLNIIGDIKINEEIQFNLKPNGIEEIQRLSNIVYLDSPIYMKVKEALEECNKTTILSLFAKKDKDKYLKGYPFYVEKLFELIKQKYISESDFIEVYKKIEKIINGKVEFSKSGEINYINENGKTIPISLTAMGISNIGIIGLLLENNIINKGSFLILDEPEVHLHPEWQIRMVETLYDIAKSGANVVIATHSIELIKYLEVIIKREKEAKDLISLNMMPYDDKFQ